MRILRRRGFTIIELLAAMAVLLIMVALLSRVFGSAASTWRAGHKRIESNNSGRAAMEFMSRELSAVVMSKKDGPTFVLESDQTNTLGMLSDSLYFVTMSHRAEYRSGQKYRDVQQVCYAVRPSVTNQPGRYALYRFVYEVFDNTNFSCYVNNVWTSSLKRLTANPTVNGSILADNVRSFEVFVTPVGEDDPQEDYSLESEPPPAAIDIYLEVLAEEDAVRASLTPGDTAFMNAATRRYATRIYVQNRAGYEDEE